MIAPWLGHAFLAFAAVLGLFTASGGADRGAYSVGIVTFAVAALLVAVRAKRQLDGAEVGFLLPVAVADFDTLIVTVALLAVLGVAGAVIAAAEGGMLYGVGLALFAVATALIFTEIKRYFDRRDEGG